MALPVWPSMVPATPVLSGAQAGASYGEPISSETESGETADDASKPGKPEKPEKPEKQGKPGNGGGGGKPDHAGKPGGK